MSYTFYKVIHFAGIFMVFMALSGLLIEAMSKEENGKNMRRWAMISHGLGLLLIFIAGFGLMARLGFISGWPSWVYVKIVVWTILGGISPLILRKRQWAKALWVLIIGLGVVAGYSATKKPSFSQNPPAAEEAVPDLESATDQ